MSAASWVKYPLWHNRTHSAQLKCTIRIRNFKNSKKNCLPTSTTNPTSTSFSSSSSGLTKMADDLHSSLPELDLELRLRCLLRFRGESDAVDILRTEDAGCSMFGWKDECIICHWRRACLSSYLKAALKRADLANCWIYLESFTIFGRAALGYQFRVNLQMALTPSGLTSFQK